MTELDLLQYKYSKLKALIENEGYLVVEGTSVELVKMSKVQSSTIETIGYNEPTKQLFVKFKGSGVYQYDNVEGLEHSALWNADSKGSHFAKFIKATKKCTKLT